MKKKTNKKINTLVAFRIMQSVYAPLVKRYKELADNNDDEHTTFIRAFVIYGHDYALDDDIEFFKLDMHTYTANVVAKNIIKLHDIYYDTYGSNFMYAIASVLASVLKDINKYDNVSL